jgi:hypothetical protein
MVSPALGAKVKRKLHVGMIDATLALVGLFAAPVRSTTGEPALDRGCGVHTFESWSVSHVRLYVIRRI